MPIPTLNAYQNPQGAPQQPGNAGAAMTQPTAPNYNFQPGPATPQMPLNQPTSKQEPDYGGGTDTVNGVVANGGTFYGSAEQVPQNVGAYQVGSQQAQANQVGTQSYNIMNDPAWAASAMLGTQAQQYGQQAQQAFNNPYVTGALGAQGALAKGPTAGQNLGGNEQLSALGQLQASAMGNNPALGYLRQAAAGQGPSAAQGQLQAGANMSMQQAEAQAASTRGNMGLANAQKNAQATNAGTMQQAANASGQLRAQEMQAAQGQYAQQLGSAQQAYAGAAGQFGQNQNSAAGLQAQAAANYGQTALAQQGQVAGYYTGQQTQLQAQQQMAENAAIAQTNANYGLAGTQLQTQTQQDIANRQQTGQEVGAGVAATGAILAAAL